MESMNYVLSIIGIIYLIYSVVRRNIVTIYHRSSRMKVLDTEKYLKLQLNYSIINSLVMITIGIIATIFKVPFMIAYAALFLFHGIHSLCRRDAKSKKYITYE